jgi:EmrB/QacA subfamily drug resistance transporter
MAPALGPAAGGILVDSFNWRAVFFMVLPFCALGSIMAMMFMPSRGRRDVRTSFDWTGLVLMALFLASLLTGLSNGMREGWGSDVILGRFAVAILAIVGFVIWESRCKQPLLNLGLFGYGRFSAASVVSFVWGAGIFGTWYLVPLFVQLVQGYTPTRSGLLLMPAGIILALLFPISGRISDKVSPHIPILGGMAITASATYLMSGADLNTPFWVFAGWLIVGRSGLGFVFPALTAGAMRALPPELIGQGASAMSYFRQLGGAFGVNLLATTVATRSAMYSEAMVSTQTAGNSATGEFLRTMQGYLAQAGTPEALRLPAAMLQLGEAIHAQATMLAFRDGFLALALVFAFAMIPAWIIGRTRAE